MRNFLYRIIYKKHDSRLIKEVENRRQEEYFDKILSNYRDQFYQHINQIKELVDQRDWNAVVKYIRILTLGYNFNVANDCLSRGDFYNELGLLCNEFEDLISKIDDKCEIKSYYLGYSVEDEPYFKNPNNYRLDKERISYNIADRPIIVRPWNASRILNNLRYINHENILNSDKDRKNIKNYYFFPMDLILCHGGNHSQLSALLQGEGTSAIETIYDIRPLYNKIRFNGNEFISKTDDRCFLSMKKNDQKITLQEKYLLGLFFETGRLLEKHIDYFPKAISGIVEKNRN